jgi:hypothetical protein
LAQKNGRFFARFLKKGEKNRYYPIVIHFTIIHLTYQLVKRFLKFFFF